MSEWEQFGREVPASEAALGVAELVFAIPGEPVPWTSTKQNRHTGNRFLPARQEEAIARNVAAMNHALEGRARPIFPRETPLLLSCVFYVKRPNSHYRTSQGRPNGVLKDWAPERPIGKPDLSNLGKMGEDCLTLAGVMPDDDQIVGHYLPWGKLYAAFDERPRMVIRVKPAEPVQ